MQFVCRVFKGVDTMFKYKSPLSRLLEGAGKAKEDDVTDSAAPDRKAPEPIADFNALREALAGGNTTSEAYEETDELIPEDKMPDFTDGDDVPDQDPTPADVADETVSEEDTEVSQEATVEISDAEPDVAQEDADQVVTLHLSEDLATGTANEAPAEPEAAPAEDVETPVSDGIAVVANTDAIQPDPEAHASADPQPESGPSVDRRSRVKTTFLGFDRADTHVQDVLETAEPVAKSETAQETFPVGWLVVTGGPGRGASVTLTEGLMQIGRKDDQAIQLDFGDTGISRSNHAVIAYDPEDRKCYLGHGGKANLVRLNGKPVLSTIALSSGDLIRISETSIRFTAFCDDGFDWRDS